MSTDQLLSRTKANTRISNAEESIGSQQLLRPRRCRVLTPKQVQAHLSIGQAQRQGKYAGLDFAMRTTLQQGLCTAMSFPGLSKPVLAPDEHDVPTNLANMKTLNHLRATSSRMPDPNPGNHSGKAKDYHVTRRVIDVVEDISANEPIINAVRGRSMVRRKTTRHRLRESVHLLLPSFFPLSS